MYRNLFDRIRNRISSPAAYSSFQKELDSKAVEQTLFNKFAGKSSFRAIVLPETLSVSSNKPESKIIRVRPLDLHDFMIPEPCSFTDSNQIKTCLALHPVAYPDSSYPFLGGNLEGVDPIGYGHIVECFYRSGPQSDGRLRGLTYRPSTIGLARDFNIGCLGVEIETGGGGSLASYASSNAKKASAAQKAFKRDKYQPYEPPPPGIQLGPFDLDTQVTEYVEKSIEENIKTYKTIDGKINSPITRVYNGMVEAFKGKVIKNGLLPKEILGQIPPDILHPGGSFERGIFIIDTARDFQRMAMAFESHFKFKMDLTDSYRTFNRQIGTKDKRIAASREILATIKPGMTDKQKAEIREKARLKKIEAATPGRSPHGWALAFDFNTRYNGKSGYASETFNWIMVNGPKYGFHSPPWARDGKGLEEWWHFEWIDTWKIYKKV